MEQPASNGGWNDQFAYSSVPLPRRNSVSGFIYIILLRFVQFSWCPRFRRATELQCSPSLTTLYNFVISLHRSATCCHIDTTLWSNILYLIDILECYLFKLPDKLFQMENQSMATFTHKLSIRKKSFWVHIFVKCFAGHSYLASLSLSTVVTWCVKLELCLVFCLLHPWMLPPACQKLFNSGHKMSKTETKFYALTFQPISKIRLLMAFSIMFCIAFCSQSLNWSSKCYSLNYRLHNNCLFGNRAKLAQVNALL